MILGFKGRKKPYLIKKAWEGFSEEGQFPVVSGGLIETRQRGVCVGGAPPGQREQSERGRGGREAVRSGHAGTPEVRRDPSQ